MRAWTSSAGASSDTENQARPSSYVYTYPSKKAVATVTGKVRTLSRLNRNLPLEVLLHNLNPVLRGWCTYFQPGVSAATFRYLRAFSWRRVIGWLRRKHPGMTWTAAAPTLLPRRLVADRRRHGAVRPGTDADHPLPLSGSSDPQPVGEHDLTRTDPDGACGEPDARQRARPVREAGRRNGPAETPAPRCGPTSQPRARPGDAVRGVRPGRGQHRVPALPASTA